LQSATERKKLGSFFVPFTSPLSDEGVLPGMMGARPVFQITSPLSTAAMACSGLELAKKTMELVVAISVEAVALIHSRRVLVVTPPTSSSPRLAADKTVVDEMRVRW